MNEAQSVFLNDEYNEWYRAKIRLFKQQHPELKKHPELWENFKFDINQVKIDSVRITEEEVVISECPSRLQTTADILCIGRTTTYDLLKKEY